MNRVTLAPIDSRDARGVPAHMSEAGKPEDWVARLMRHPGFEAALRDSLGSAGHTCSLCGRGPAANAVAAQSQATIRARDLGAIDGQVEAIAAPPGAYGVDALAQEETSNSKSVARHSFVQDEEYVEDDTVSSRPQPEDASVREAASTSRALVVASQGNSRQPRRSSILRMARVDQEALRMAEWDDSDQGEGVSCAQREAMVLELLKGIGAPHARFVLHRSWRRLAANGLLGLFSLWLIFAVFFPLGGVDSLYFRVTFAFQFVVWFAMFQTTSSSLVAHAPLLVRLLDMLPDSKRARIQYIGRINTAFYGLFVIVGFALRVIWYGNSQSFVLLFNYVLVNVPSFFVIGAACVGLIGAYEIVGAAVAAFQERLDVRSEFDVDIRALHLELLRHNALIKEFNISFARATDIAAFFGIGGTCFYLLAVVFDQQWGPNPPEIVDTYMIYGLLASWTVQLTASLSTASTTLRRTLRHINEAGLEDDTPAMTTEHTRLVQRLQTMREFFGFRVFGMVVTSDLITQVASTMISVLVFSLARLLL